MKPNPILAFDWDSMIATASHWSSDESLAWQRVLSARIIEQVKADPDSFAANLSADDAARLPNNVINALVEMGILLEIGAAAKYGGYNSNNSLISAVKYASHPLSHIQQSGGRYLFSRKWIDDYKQKSPGRGRPKNAY